MGKTIRCPQTQAMMPRGQLCDVCGKKHWGSGKSTVSGHHRTNFDDAPFIAVDSEGYNDANGKHVLSLVAASDGSELRGDASDPLRTQAICDYLLSLSERNTGAIFTIYNGGYDFNMWLGDVSKDNIQELWENRDKHTRYTPILDGTYEVSILPRKYVKIRQVSNKPRFIIQRNKDGSRRLDKDGKVIKRRNVLRSITIWDVFGFFQASFVGALEQYGFGDHSFIREMKKQRQHFTADDADTVAKYCHQECDLLVQLMDKLRDAMKAANLRASRWDGAGAVAAALMKREQVKRHMDKDPAEHIWEAAKGAYSGGRIEQVKYGYYPDTLYQYDRRSSYPASMPDLPSLAGGVWTETDYEHSADFSLVYVEWNLPLNRPFYPFFWRASDHRISYPAQGRGWHHKVEVAAAIRAEKRPLSGQYYIRPLKCYSFTPANDEKPFSFVPALYTERQRLKREKNAAEKAIKLGINSLYGKMAQQIGYKENAETGEITKPPYFQLEWAGYITAATRAALYETAMIKPRAVVSFMTDALILTEPLDIPCDDVLGQWEPHTYTGGVFAQSGVYFVEDNGQWKHKFRGFDPGVLTVDKVRSALLKGEQSIDVRQTRFVGMGQALRGAWELWRTWHTDTRTLVLTPDGYKDKAGKWHNGTKRRSWKRQGHWYLTTAYDPPDNQPGSDSTPHSILWEATAEQREMKRAALARKFDAIDSETE